MKQIWNFLKSLQLTFWLLFIITAMFIAGSLYSRADYSFFEAMNNKPIITWLSEIGIHTLHKTWWIILLFISMALLAVNTVACAADRLYIIWPKRKNISLRIFLTLISPSIIHILFIIVLFGHFLTFTVISHQRYPVEKGTLLTLPNNVQLRINDITMINYPPDSYLKDRLMNGILSVSEITQSGENNYSIKFLEPVSLNGAYLHIDVAKRVTPESNTTVCSRAEVKRTEQVMPQFYLLYTEDPGLMVIVVFLFIMIGFLFWYYGNNLLMKKTFTE
ncbi:MAG TPA: hypothetical protein PLT75_08070 [Spirochaetota bacterium]|nr:hypothetical protein [Spirochaetota bacterium]